MTLLHVTLLLFLQVPTAPPRDTAPSAQAVGNGVIRGRVLDALTGQPIKGALVTLHVDRQPLATATDADGRWEIPGLPLGEYLPVAAKSGYVDSGMTFTRSVGLTEATPERTVDLKIVRGAVLSGRVTDADGEPVAGVQVTALAEISIGPNQRRWNGLTGATTDDRGHFRVYGLAAGEYLLAAQRHDRQFAAGSKGRRIADVRTYYPGTTTVAEAQRLSVADAAEYSDLTFALETTASIAVSGRVVVSADQIRQGSGMMMPVGEQVDPFGSSAMMMLEPDGSFRIHSLTAGSYQLTVEVELANGEREVGQLAIEAADQDISGLVIRTRGATRLTGRVVVEPLGASAPALLRVAAMPVGNRMSFGGPQDAVVKPDGTFELKVFDSPVKLYQTGPRQAGWMQKSIRWKGQDVSGGLTFEAGEPVDGVEIVIRRVTSRISGSVSGTVAPGESGEEGVVIAFRDGAFDPTGRGVSAMAPIRDGRFSLGPVPSGEYQLVAVRSADPAFFEKIELMELLRARAIVVTVGDNESKSIGLTLVTDF